MVRTEDNLPNRSKQRKRVLTRVLIGLCIAVMLFIVISFIVSKIVYDKQFPRYDRPDENLSAQLRYSDMRTYYPRRLVQFPSGKTLLQGYLYGAENSRGLMVISHGIGGGADSYLPQIKHFVDSGLRVFAYDCTGSYASEGESTKGFVQSVLDLHAALVFIGTQAELSQMPLLLFGHSWGGYAVANVLHYPHEIRGVISVSGVNTAMDIIVEQGKSLMGGFIYTQYPFLALYQRFLFGDAASFDAVSAINASDIPMLIIHGVSDEMVAFDKSALIAQKDAITNANVRYVAADTPGRDGHNNLFRTDAAITYVNEINESYRALFNSYDGTIPYEVNKRFYDGIDRNMLHELEPDLMLVIDDFIEHALRN